MLSNYDYYCPHCYQNIRTRDWVRFKVQKEDDLEADLFLSPSPQDYSYHCLPDLKLRPGDRLEFSCFNCKESLQSKEYPKFVNIHLKVTESIVFDILFSPVCGVKQTFIEMEGDLEPYTGNFLSFHTPRKTG